MSRVRELVMTLEAYRQSYEAQGVTVAGVAKALPSTERAKLVYTAAKGRTTDAEAIAADGLPLTLTPAQISAAYDAVQARYEACMAAYHAIYPLILNGTITTEAEIASQPAWPA